MCQAGADGGAFGVTVVGAAAPVHGPMLRGTVDAFGPPTGAAAAIFAIAFVHGPMLRGTLPAGLGAAAVAGGAGGPGAAPLIVELLTIGAVVFGVVELGGADGLKLTALLVSPGALSTVPGGVDGSTPAVDESPAFGAAPSVS